MIQKEADLYNSNPAIQAWNKESDEFKADSSLSDYYAGFNAALATLPESPHGMAKKYIGEEFASFVLNTIENNSSETAAIIILEELAELIPSPQTDAVAELKLAEIEERGHLKTIASLREELDRIKSAYQIELDANSKIRFEHQKLREENERLKKEIRRLQEKYDENGYDSSPLIMLQRIDEHISLSLEIYQKEVERLTKNKETLMELVKKEWDWAANKKGDTVIVREKAWKNFCKDRNL